MHTLCTYVSYVYTYFISLLVIMSLYKHACVSDFLSLSNYVCVSAYILYIIIMRICASIHVRTFSPMYEHVYEYLHAYICRTSRIHRKDKYSYSLV